VTGTGIIVPHRQPVGIINWYEAVDDSGNIGFVNSDYVQRR
jgi:hypothetical protein